MNWKQFLTEKVLKEPEATSEYTVANNGDLVSVKTVIKNRTFDNRNDLLDLYEAIYRGGKWDEFFWFSASHCKPKREGLGCSETTAWLFCLNGKGYEKRNKMVADFYGWNEQRDPVIDKNSGAYGDN